MWEKYHPTFISALMAIIIWFWNPSVLAKFEKVLDGTITFSSIITGFLASMLAILVSIKESKIIKAIYRNFGKGNGNGNKLIQSYLNSVIMAGLVTVIVSASLYVIIYDLKDALLFKRISLVFWCSLVTYFLLSTYRVIRIILLIVFIDADEYERKPIKNHKLTAEEEIEFKRIHSKNQNK